MPLDDAAARLRARAGALAIDAICLCVHGVPTQLVAETITRDGLEIHAEQIDRLMRDRAAELSGLSDAMWLELENAPLLCAMRTNTEGLWVFADPAGHVVFPASHDGERVNDLLATYAGEWLIDERTTLNVLSRVPERPELDSWYELHRRLLRALAQEPERAREGLHLLDAVLFLERESPTLNPSQRLSFRQRHTAPALSKLLAWLEAVHRDRSLAGSELAAVAAFVADHIHDLRELLLDPRILLDDGRGTPCFDDELLNRTFASLLASCRIHGLDSEDYVRNLLCQWPHRRSRPASEFSPLAWAKSR